VRAPGNRLSAFDQLNTTSRSRLSPSRLRTPRGRRALRGRIGADGGAGNTYARAILNVDWHAGDDVRYRASFYLPRGFKRAMQGEVDLMRWDDYPIHDHVDPGVYSRTARRAAIGGVALFHGDRKLHLIAGTPTEFRSLLGGYPISEGRWHTIAVRQRFAAARPLSELFLDGRRLGRTTARAFEQLPIDRLRVGLVAIGSGTQTKPLALWFGDVRTTVVR
jgi:hypothetical protein